jgi:hypothetical protein
LPPGVASSGSPSRQTRLSLCLALLSAHCDVQPAPNARCRSRRGTKQGAFQLPSAPSGASAGWLPTWPSANGALRPLAEKRCSRGGPGAAGGGLEVDERNFAGPIAPLIDCQASSSSAPRRSAIPQWDPVGHRISTRLFIRSWPTSCSSSSTSGRRSTSRRSARSPRWTPERARLPRTPCLAADRVTVACAYVRSTVATALGRSHAVGAAESGQ